MPSITKSYRQWRDQRHRAFSPTLSKRLMKLILQYRETACIRSTSGAFSIKAARDNGYEILPITGPNRPLR